MIVVALAIAALLLGTCACRVVIHRRRTPAELRGDWWMNFERDFRAYCAQTPNGRPKRKRQGQGPSAPPR